MQGYQIAAQFLQTVTVPQVKNQTFSFSRRTGRNPLRPSTLTEYLFSTAIFMTYQISICHISLSR